ncbi:MAG: DDE-type integrase/transposase/recombinase [Pseudomonadota bacterium]
MRKCMATEVARRLASQSVLAVLADLVVRRGVPDLVRSDNGPEFAAHAVREWIAKVGTRPHAARASPRDVMKPGSLWEHGYNANAPRPLLRKVNGRFRDELLNTELFNDLGRRRF